MVLCVSPDSKTAARGGIDLGGTKIQTVIVDADNEVLGESRRPTPTSGGPEDVTREMSEAMAEAAAQAKLKTGELAGIGVSSPRSSRRRSTLRSRSETTSRLPSRASSSSAPGRSSTACSASGGAPASGAA
jgi:predicted NBD/HSP70 family sugar kinase